MFYTDQLFLETETGLGYGLIVWVMVSLIEVVLLFYMCWVGKEGLECEGKGKRGRGKGSLLHC